MQQQPANRPRFRLRDAPEEAVPIVVFAIGLPIGLVIFGFVGLAFGEPIALALLPELGAGEDQMRHRVLGLLVSIVTFTLLSALVVISARVKPPRLLTGVIAGVLTLILGSNSLWLGSRNRNGDERVFGSAVERVDAFQVGLGAGLLGVFGTIGLFVAFILIMARVRRAGRPKGSKLLIGFAACLVIGWVGALLLVALPGR